MIHICNFKNVYFVFYLVSCRSWRTSRMPSAFRSASLKRFIAYWFQNCTIVFRFLSLVELTNNNIYAIVTVLFFQGYFLMFRKTQQSNIVQCPRVPEVLESITDTLCMFMGIETTILVSNYACQKYVLLFPWKQHANIV